MTMGHRLRRKEDIPSYITSYMQSSMLSLLCPRCMASQAWYSIIQSFSHMLRHCRSLLSLAPLCINWASFYSQVWILLLVLYRWDRSRKKIACVFCSCSLHRTLTYIYSYCILSYPFISYQDAGLIFLSAMANNIAESILDKGGSVEEVISTTLVILSLGTASMGVVLALLGKYQLLDIVSYLPMPVSCD